jgi:hypothetical protein
MRTTLLAVLLSASLLLAARSVHAHHSFAADFDINKPVTLTGVLVRMDWVNPHGWMYVDVKAADGTMVRWAIQTGGPTQLLRRGLGKDTFRRHRVRSRASRAETAAPPPTLRRC